MKKLIVITMILALFSGPRLSLADMSNTVDYLQNQTTNDWIAQALLATGEQNVDISFIDAGTDDLMSAVKHLLTLSAAESADQESLNALLSTIKANYSNGQLGSELLLNDDFWGLMALSSVGDDAYQSSIKDFILQNQNTDGGWGWAVGESSDTNDTAAAIMALLDTDLTAQSTEIVQALAYLQSAQNDDGGFAYDIEGSSDGASTAWIIAALNKSNIDIVTWQKNNNSPIDFLSSLEQADGSYLWLPGDSNGSSIVTSYAVVALTNNFYPINYIELVEEEENQVGVDIRIEGPDNTVCLASNLQVGNILEVLAEVTGICNINYEVTDTAYGPYVSSIADIDSVGMDGWQYWVNWEAGMISAADYNLVDGDVLLWGYGGFPLYASRLELNKNIVASGEEFVATLTYFDGSAWQVIYNEDLYVGDTVYQTDVNGQVSIVIIDDGVYPIFLEQVDSYVRSNKAYITVGDGISESVDLTVNIENQSGGDEDVIAFSVSQSSIDFGDLKPGQSAETSLSLHNTGNVNIYIEADILGSEIWQDNTTLNQSDWLDFSEEVSESQSLPINVRLSLPTSIGDRGQVNGQLIFWAIAR